MTLASLTVHEWNAWNAMWTLRRDCAHVHQCFDFQFQVPSLSWCQVSNFLDGGILNWHHYWEDFRMKVGGCDDELWVVYRVLGVWQVYWTIRHIGRRRNLAVPHMPRHDLSVEEMAVCSPETSIVALVATDMDFCRTLSLSLLAQYAVGLCTEYHLGHTESKHVEHIVLVVSFSNHLFYITRIAKYESV